MKLPLIGKVYKTILYIFFKVGLILGHNVKNQDLYKRLSENNYWREYAKNLQKKANNILYLGVIMISIICKNEDGTRLI